MFIEFQAITDGTGKVLAVMSYAPLSFAQEVARQYARILGCNVYRHTVTMPAGVQGPIVGSINLEWSRSEQHKP